LLLDRGITDVVLVETERTSEALVGVPGSRSQMRLVFSSRATILNLPCYVSCPIKW